MAQKSLQLNGLKIRYKANSGDLILSGVSKVDSTKSRRYSLNLAFFTCVYKKWEQKLDLLQWSQLRKTQPGKVEVHWQGTGNSALLALSWIQIKQGILLLTIF